MRKRCSGGLPGARASASRRDRAAQAAQLVVVLDDFSAMSSPNHFACSCASEWQPTLTQQRRVVDDRARLLVEPDPLGQPQRDQALPQHVLHRLAEAEVDAERKRRDELGEADRCARQCATGRDYSRRRSATSVSVSGRRAATAIAALAVVADIAVLAGDSANAI